MQETENHFVEQGELIKLYCGSHLKYHQRETDTYAEIYQFRETLRQ